MMLRVGWAVALVLVAAAGFVTSQRVHSFGIEGPAVSVGGLVPWALVISVPLLLLALVVHRRNRTSLILVTVACVVLGVALMLDWTGLGWLMGVR